MWPVLAAVAWGGGIYLWTSVDPAAARRRVVLRPTAAASVAPDARPWWVSSGQAARLAVLGLTPAAYGQSLLGGIGLGGAAGFLLTRSVFVAILGALVGWGYQAFRVLGRHARWQRDVSRAVPDLVRLLTLHLNAGATTAQAVTRIGRYLRGPVAVEWARLLAAQEAGTPLDDALRDLDDRVADRHLTAVISRIRTYHRTGVPEEPFGDMADHLTRIVLVQQQTRMRQLTAPLTWYALAGFVGVFLVLMAPSLLREITNTLGGNPLF